MQFETFCLLFCKTNQREYPQTIVYEHLNSLRLKIFDFNCVCKVHPIDSSQELFFAIFNNQLYLIHRYSTQENKQSYRVGGIFQKNPDDNVFQIDKFQVRIDLTTNQIIGIEIPTNILKISEK